MFDVPWLTTLYTVAQATTWSRVWAIVAASWLIWALGAWYLVAFVWHKRGGLRELAALVVGGGLGYLFNAAISFLWFRPRPFVTLDFSPLINVWNAKSFPSDHAATAFFVATLLYLHHPRWWGAYLVAGLVALGRVAVGVHYPSDVLAGAIIGIVFGFVVRVLENHFVRSAPAHR